MAEVQESLSELEVEASAGGGAVTVRMNGKMMATSVTLKPEAVDPEDVEMLEDMILAALGEAHRKAEALAAEEMSKVTGGMDLPGLS
jgi:hypothetical protein